MEERGAMSPSGVITVKGDETLASRTEFQQNPSFLPSVGPTTVVSPLPPAPTTVTPGSAAAALPPSISSAGTDLTKKKRGRPRKYAPDGRLNPRASRPTLFPTPISSSIPFYGDYHHHSHWKRGKAQQQPGEFINISNKFEYASSPAPPPAGLSCYVGANFTTHQLIVNAGEDVTMKVMPYSQGSRAICILSATGRSSGMSISLAGPNGKIFDGGLTGMLIAAGPVQVIMGSFIVMHQAEQTEKKKPRIMEASPPPPQPQQQQLYITTVNTTSPVVASAEEPKQQTYSGGGGTVIPLSQMPSSFQNDNSVMNNITTTYQGYGNMNTGTTYKEEDDYDDGWDVDSGDARSLSNSG